MLYIPIGWFYRLCISSINLIITDYSVGCNICSRFCTVKAILGRKQPGRLRWILLWIMTLAHDRSLDLLTSSPPCHHCTTATSVLICVKFNNSKTNSCTVIRSHEFRHKMQTVVITVVLCIHSSWHGAIVWCGAEAFWVFLPVSSTQHHPRRPQTKLCQVSILPTYCNFVFKPVLCAETKQL